MIFKALVSLYMNGLIVRSYAPVQLIYGYVEDDDTDEIDRNPDHYSNDEGSLHPTLRRNDMSASNYSPCTTCRRVQRAYSYPDPIVFL